MKNVYIKPENCIGCKHCEVACAVEHSETKNLYSAISEKPLPTSKIHVMPTFGVMTYPGKCMHCDPTPCINVCPSGAITKDQEFDIILINEEKCIECGMCAIACPFNAVSFNPSWRVSIEREIANKCDNCHERITNDLIPACVEACKTGALSYGDINEIIKKERRAIGKTAAQFAAAVPIEERIPELLKVWRDMALSMTQLGEKK
ncbi:MAG: 4Fe-4S dicluster domain-containing protein [Promethearchaeota archaeon]